MYWVRVKHFPAIGRSRYVLGEWHGFFDGSVHRKIGEVSALDSHIRHPTFFLTDMSYSRYPMNILLSPTKGW